MTTAQLVALLIALAVFWTGALACVLLLLRAANVADQLLGLAEGMLTPGEEPADVRDLRTGRPHLRVVVDHVGDEVEHNVFPTGDAA